MNQKQITKLFTMLEQIKNSLTPSEGLYEKNVFMPSEYDTSFHNLREKYLAMKDKFAEYFTIVDKQSEEIKKFEKTLKDNLYKIKYLEAEVESFVKIRKNRRFTLQF